MIFLLRLGRKGKMPLQHLQALTHALTLLLFGSSTLLADWQAGGESRFSQISGNPAELATTVTLDVPPPGAETSLHFGPVPVAPSARELNVEAEILTSIPKGKSFRLTLYLTSGKTFPGRDTDILTRTHRPLKGEEKGRIGFNATLPRNQTQPLNAFIEVSSCDLDRSGKPSPPAPGKVAIRNLNLLTSILPASPSAAAALPLLSHLRRAVSHRRFTWPHQ